MANIYLSATYQDLKSHRDAVYRILRMLRHDVISMEDYVATDAYPLHKCLADVAGCDVYVGLIGWRYGYVPGQDNPDGRSITELEYRQAGDSGKPRLLFLADPAAEWPDEFKDSHTGEGDAGARIAAFRAELGAAKLVSHFHSPDDLAKLVSVAVTQCLAEHPSPGKCPPSPRLSLHFSGRAKLDFCRRLGHDWKPLADILEIPGHDTRTFPLGDEARSVWDWLEVRRRLPELVHGVKSIGRGDLAGLFGG